MSLKSDAIHASIWASLTEIMVKATTPLSFIIIARILTPDDYGIIAVAITVLSFVTLISDLGTSQIIIQYKGNDENDFFTQTLFINAIMGFFLCLLLFVLSPTISNVFKVSDSTGVIRLAAFQILFQSLSITQTAIL